MNVSAALSLVFFVSGAAALLFETLWFRQAGLGFGNSLWASSMVLASFMGGLAVGNALILRYGARVERPIRLYALLEIAIAVAGFLLVLALPAIGTSLVPLLRPVADVPWIANPLRLGIGFVVLLIPASAMGATLPLLVKALRREDPSYGSALGRLYGWNTLGGVVGALAGEGLLFAALGIRGAAAVAAGLNLTACGLSLLLSRRLEGPTSAPPEPLLDAAPRGLSLRAVRLLAATFLTGFLLLALEVVWFRLLLQFVYGTGIAFSLLLAVVLAAIGIGGRFGGFIVARLPGSTASASACALAAGGIGVGLYVVFPQIVARYGTQQIVASSDILLLVAAISAPVAVFSGALFTLTGAALAAAIPGETRATGWLTLANTTGSGLGSLLAGFVLIPWAGVEASLFLLCTGYVAVAILLWLPPPLASPARRPVQVATGLLALAFALTLVLFPFGQMREQIVDTVVQRHGNGSARVAAYREGRGGNVLYLQRLAHGEPTNTLLVTDGFAMSGSEAAARRYMKLFVYWPVAVHPDLRKALLISYGVGSTAKALTETASLEHIDVVDTSREILELSPVIHGDDDPLDDPRVHTHIEDGRYFLKATRHEYDLITGEPPPPTLAGVWSLYTREHFAEIRERLAEGGISTYWIPAHSMSVDGTRAVIRAYCDVFPDCSLWNGSGLDWMIVGTKDAKVAVSDSDFVRQWFDPRIAPELARVGFERPEQLGATFMADAPTLERLTRGVAPLTDDAPSAVSRLAPPPTQIVRMLGRWMNAPAAKKRFEESVFIERIWPSGWRQASLHMFEYQRMLTEVNGRQLPLPRLLGDVFTLQQSSELRTLVLWKLGFSTDDLDVLVALEARGVAMGKASELRAARALMHRHYAEAARWYGSARDESPRDAYLTTLQAYALAMADRKRGARELLEDAAAVPSSRSRIRGVERWFERHLPLD